MRGRFWLLIGIWSLLLFGHAQAATYYTATTGSDTNPCTSAAKCRTLGRSLSLTGAGDTVEIGPGLYAEALLNVIPSGVTLQPFVGATITLKPPAGTKIIALTNGQDGVRVQRNGGWIVLDGASLAVGSPTTPNPACVDLGGGAVGNFFDGLEIHHCPGSGFHVGDSGAPWSDGNTLQNSLLHDNGTDPNHDHGAYLESSNNLILNSTFSSNKGYGIHNFNGHGSGLSHDNAFIGNTLYSNTLCGLVMGSGANNLAARNRSYSNALCGYRVGYQGATNTLLVHNVSDGDANLGFHVVDGSTVVLKNNISLNNGTNVLPGGNTICDHNRFSTGGTTPCTTNTGNTSGAVGFVNAVAHDYLLAVGSAAIDAGVVLTPCPHGMDCSYRGVAPDLGAYEFGGSPPNAPTNPSASFTVQ